ncbi:energy transducer TonB [bacterium]|nr:energy transducer TonB [bacterium]MBT3581594.1 energy transducer TonB [bacterium]MBT4552843.1 energy transducer TonB [bacterium]
MKKHLLSFLLAVSLILLLFYFLAETHLVRISLQNLHLKPTTFYKVFKVKRAQKIPKKKLIAPKKVALQKTDETYTPKEEEESPPKEKIADISDVDNDAVIIERVIPKYPEVARKAGIECKLIVEIIINERGRVIHASIVNTDRDTKDYGFEKNALAAVKKLRFEPFIQNNQPVKVKIFYPIDFILIE